ncbi:MULTISPECIES: hypothetical protein [Methylomonas]|uniref:PEP-CTERM protein-sorting domain-containing protein n=2 Tax=Methylomonas TaxID=416 RepID=A0A140E5A0_9GAMM|nr:MULTISPECIES: hypothetical protein [Methylomonas]AMK75574.1 hypothetical protein JT25_003575 [Methylomonas denitrificans]OAI09191.1 hypothetical protein A1342_08330 [Methylomonas methanica]TCV79071.1 hypothetical protein EDE11_12248 [Methylomonas methanica]
MIKKSVLAAALLSAICTQAEAITITADGAWHAFDVDPSVSSSGYAEWIDLNNDTLSFDFSLSGSAILKVVDAGFAGDRFAVFNGVGSLLLGPTSSPVNNYPVNVGTDFNAAFADTNYSRGEFLLGPGNYQIFGYLLESALDDSNSAIDATVGAISLTAVPLPAAAGLYAAGAGLLGLVSRRRKSTR